MVNFSTFTPNKKNINLNCTFTNRYIYIYIYIYIYVIYKSFKMEILRW